MPQRILIDEDGTVRGWDEIAGHYSLHSIESNPRGPRPMTTTEKTLTQNIRSTITKAKRRGVVGMSLANLKQCTPTTGLTCPPGEYHREFPRVAAQVAARLSFPVY